MSNENSVWFITGCSSGFGRCLALQALANGHRVVATARDKLQIADLVAGHEGRALGVQLDVTKQEQISIAVAEAEHHFGRIDVLVNNAGYGYQSTVEEGHESEIRAQFDVNVFGLFAVTRAVLPGMRKRRYGKIMNVTSIAGMSGFAGSGYYAASKHAVEGFSDSLAAECGPLGISVTCVEPGPTKTDWAGRSLRQTSTCIADYQDTAGARMDAAVKASGGQPGNPQKVAQLLLQIASLEKPPRNIALGSRAIDLGIRRLKQKISSIEAWEQQGRETDD